MSFLIKTPKAPTLAAPRPVPTRDDSRIDKTREDFRNKRGVTGRNPNILTSPLGASDSDGTTNIRRPALLGQPA